MAAAWGTDELIGEARGKLRVVEEELRVAKGELAAEKARGDALLIAEAKLGVAEAKMGVAEAKWQAAEGDDKAVFQETFEAARASVRSAQAVLETANIAYKNALQAAAPPHGEPSQPLNLAAHGHNHAPGTAVPRRSVPPRGCWPSVGADAPNPLPHTCTCTPQHCLLLVNGPE